jgi:hypothetical protein
MTSLPNFRGRAPWVLAVLGAALLAGGCTRLLPQRHGEAVSAELILDTRRDANAALSGRFIPGITPAVTHVPVVFTSPLPRGAVITEVTCETLKADGAPLSLLQGAVDAGHPYLYCSSAKMGDVSEVHVIVHARYSYPW